MTASRSRALLLIAVLCLLAVGVALVSQHVFDTPPCAWCVLQRLIYLCIAVVCLIGAATNAIVSRLCAGLATILALSGIASAWYQHSVASKLLSCDMTFADRFISHSGLDALIPPVFGIYASCMDAVTMIAGIEFSIWSLMLFVLVALLGAFALTRPTRALIPA